MTSLYTKDGIIGKLWEQFSGFFSEQTKPTAQHLFELVVSVFALNGFHSVKYSFDHFIGEISHFELKSFYYALNESKINLQDWMKHLIDAASSMLCETTVQALILAIDDTLIEKFGQHFEHRSKLFDHADPDFLPLTIYALRWNIEVSYYEQKTFWALGDYRLRSQSGIERLVNLLTVCYSSVKLLPYLSEDFSALKDLSAQQARFKLGELIRREVFFVAFVDHLETTKNPSALVNLLICTKSGRSAHRRR